MVKFRFKTPVKCTLLLIFMFFLLILVGIGQIPTNMLNKLDLFKKKIYYLHWISDMDVDKEWVGHRTEACEEKFIGYGNDFAVLRNVVFVPEEDFYFKLSCNSNEVKKYTFKTALSEKNHLNHWLHTMEITSPGEGTGLMLFNKKKTLFVQRFEFANLYHQMTDFYNAFLVAKLLNIPPDDLDVVIMDRSAPIILDKTWDVLFGDVTKVKDMKDPVVYKEIIWAVLGYNSPMNFHSLNSMPYVEEFSHFFKARYGARTKSLECAGLSILFIWRRDYVAYPGSPTLSRKIKNEKELVEAVQEIFPGHSVAGIQLDEHEMKDQVKWISQTDILVGMHGAGMSHIMELPGHAGVLELFPTYWHKTNRHFRAMARWRGLHYRSWQNLNPGNEYKDKFTRIPPLVVTHDLLSLYMSMCGHLPAPSKL